MEDTGGVGRGDGEASAATKFSLGKADGGAVRELNESPAGVVVEAAALFSTARLLSESGAVTLCSGVAVGPSAGGSGIGVSSGIGVGTRSAAGVAVGMVEAILAAAGVDVAATIGVGVAVGLIEATFAATGRGVAATIGVGNAAGFETAS